MVCFQRGRVAAKHKAVETLFKRMKGPSGGQIALTYLSKFADKWPQDQIDDSLKKPRSVRITFDEP
jgi:hypothetical protein